MICFEFIIFALRITSRRVANQLSYLLWFASNLLFLHYESHLFPRTLTEFKRCDLLRIYYFCTTNHIVKQYQVIMRSVVICFEFIIFALRITSTEHVLTRHTLLWFASNLLFLHYESHQASFYSYLQWCCDLLRIYYFCTTNHINSTSYNRIIVVVICFEFIIFALRITSETPLKFQQ